MTEKSENFHNNIHNTIFKFRNLEEGKDYIELE
jgi:hypothetical protein